MPLANQRTALDQAANIHKRFGTTWTRHCGCLLIMTACSAVQAVSETQESPAVPNAISSIQTRSPYCFQPDRTRDECVIGFESHQVSTSASMRKLQITIGGRRVVEDRAFFQSDQSLGLNEVGRPGYRVPCGVSGAGGDPDVLIGHRYSYSISAEDSDGLTSQNFGTLGCPAIPTELFRNGFEAS